MKPTLALASTIVCAALASCVQSPAPVTPTFDTVSSPYPVRVGDTYWVRTYNSANDFNCGTFADDDIAVAGSNYTKKNGSYCALMNPDGSVIWEHFGTDGGPIFGQMITHLVSGRIITAGYVRYDQFALFEARADSVVLFGAFPEEPQASYAATGFLPTADGGVIVEGSRQQDYEPPHSFVAKFSAAGKLEWKDNLDPVLGDHDVQINAGAVTLANDGSGDILVANDQKQSLGVSRISGDGAVLWQKLYDVNAIGAGLGIVPVSGGYIVGGGEHRQFDSLDGATLVKVDQNGKLLWRKAFFNTYDIPAPMIADSNGATFLCENRLVHVNADGAVTYEAFPLPYADRWEAANLLLNKQGDLVFAGRDNGYASAEAHATLRKVHLKQ